MLCQLLAVPTWTGLILLVLVLSPNWPEIVPSQAQIALSLLINTYDLYRQLLFANYCLCRFALEYFYWFVVPSPNWLKLFVPQPRVYRHFYGKIMVGPLLMLFQLVAIADLYGKVLAGIGTIAHLPCAVKAPSPKCTIAFDSMAMFSICCHTLPIGRPCRFAQERFVGIGPITQLPELFNPKPKAYCWFLSR